MSDDWKDKPHWVLRFNESGMWQLVGPDGEIKHISGLAQRRLTVDLDYMDVPKFDMSGLLYADLPNKKP